MDDLVFTIDGFLQRLLGLGSQVRDAVGAVELWLRTQLALRGLAPTVQIMMLVGLTGLVVLIAAHLPDGLFRTAVIVAFVLIGVHFMLPVFQP